MTDVNVLLEMEGLIEENNRSGIKRLSEQQRGILHDRSVAEEITWLHYALRFKQPELARFFFEQGVPLNTTDEHGGSPLDDAANLRDVELVRWMVENGADPRVSQWAMIHAVSNGSLEIVKLLVDKGAEYNFIFGEPLRTPLSQALDSFGLSDIVEFLRSVNALMPAEAKRRSR